MKGKIRVRSAMKPSTLSGPSNRYLKDFYRVQTCYQHNPDFDFITRTTGLSKHLGQPICADHQPISKKYLTRQFGPNMGGVVAACGVRRGFVASRCDPYAASIVFSHVYRAVSR